jgi:hypothetical protein
MTELKMNNQGEQVIAISPYFYQTLKGMDSFVCCGEYQNAVYCFGSNTKQGCVFCELDYTEPCECAVCEK